MNGMTIDAIEPEPRWLQQRSAARRNPPSILDVLDPARDVCAQVLHVRAFMLDGGLLAMALSRLCGCDTFAELMRNDQPSHTSCIALSCLNHIDIHQECTPGPTMSMAVACNG